MMKGLATATRTYSAMPFSATGEPYVPLDTSLMGRAWEAALRTWNAERRTHAPFTFADGDGHYMGQILPYGSKGAALAMGTLIELGPFERWTAGERNVLLTGGFLLVFLAILLLWALIRARQREARVRRQEKHSRTQERKLAKALGEREILDREVHHRVKNNLQVVSSLLNLQMQRITDGNARNEFARGKRRIDSMALVHHKLYRQYDLRAIDLKAFLSDLAEAVSAMYEPDSRAVSHSVDTLGIRGDADTSIVLGMVLCELLSNCYQHAFPYATGGHIEIILRRMEGDLYRLTVKDNGRGIDVTATRDEQLGLEIVEALAEQLDGSMSARNLSAGPDAPAEAGAEGTSVDVLFRMQRGA
jgi:two-component sensor histidine kinase